MSKHKNNGSDADRVEVSESANEQALESFLLAAMMKVQNPDLDIDMHELAYAVCSTPSNIPDTVEIVYSTPNGLVTENYNIKTKKG